MELSEREQIAFGMLAKRRIVPADEILKELKRNRVKINGARQSHSLSVMMKYLTAKACQEGWIITMVEGGQGAGNKAAYQNGKEVLMNREEAETAMNKMLDEAAAKGIERNVETLRYTNKALRRGMLPPEPQTPGTRPDGGMAPAEMNPVQLVSNALTDARRIVDNFEKSTIELESKIAELEARLAGERDRCIRLEKMLQEIVDLVSPR